MAHNHRGQRIADPYLNLRREMRDYTPEMLAYNPEEVEYDEASGPLDRTRRMRYGLTGIGGSIGVPVNRHEYVDEQMEDLRGEGEV